MADLEMKVDGGVAKRGEEGPVLDAISRPFSELERDDFRWEAGRETDEAVALELGLDAGLLGHAAPAREKSGGVREPLSRYRAVRARRRSLGERAPERVITVGARRDGRRHVRH